MHILRVRDLYRRIAQKLPVHSCECSVGGVEAIVRYETEAFALPVICVPHYLCEY